MPQLDHKRDSSPLRSAYRLIPVCSQSALTCCLKALTVCVLNVLSYSMTIR